MDDFIFVYSMGRSGGGSLCNAIVNLVDFDHSYYEPFNDHFFEKSSDKSDYKSIIENFFDGGRVFVKHNVENFLYLDENVSEDLDCYLFQKFDKVIVNNRSNWLKHALSEVIADRTGNWHDHHSQSDLSESFEVSFSIIEKLIERRRSEWRDRVDYIRNNNEVESVWINYENFYNQIDLKSRVEHLIDIIKNFYELPVDKSRIERVYNILSKKYKINNKSSYRVVSNNTEINQKLGKEYGFLF